MNSFSQQCAADIPFANLRLLSKFRAARAAALALLLSFSYISPIIFPRLGKCLDLDFEPFSYLP